MLKSIFTGLFFLTGLLLFSQEKPNPSTGANSIKSEEIKSYLRTLTSDEFAGRETGKKGQKLAGNFLAEKMKEFGMKPGNDTSFFQVFEVIEMKPDGEIVLDGITHKFLKNFYFLGVKDTAISAPEILFCGYGIDDPKYSDYAKVNVKGKVILILEGEPIGKDSVYLISGTKTPSKWKNDMRKKAAIAKDKGALGVFYYSKSYSASKSNFYHFIEKPSMTLKGDIKEEKERTRANFFYIGDTLLNEILTKNLAAKKELTRLLNSGGRPKKYPVIKTSLEIKIKKISSDLKTENVIGFIEGTDKKDEVIIITAHYDHLGVQGKDIYYGADDDGSGTAAILEIGQAFMEMVKAGNRPRRSIIIMPVSGEEKGLLGSRYFTLNPTVPLSNIVADLNIDMIGRRDEKYANDPNYVYVIGSEMLSDDLKIVSENANKENTKIKLDYMYDDQKDPNKFYYRSDHYNFAKNNIPVIFYFCGVHDDYHKPTDTFDKIEFDKMETITRLVFYTAWELANREERIKLKEQKP
jgi:hypothetical protein